MKRILATTAVLLVLTGCSASGGNDSVTTDTPAPSTDSSSTTEGTSKKKDPTTTTPETTTPKTTTPETTTTVATKGTEQKPLKLGTGTEIGDYKVVVKSVDLDATDDVQAGNEFNEPPANGVYGVATITVRYLGDAEGTPGYDLNTTLQGGNGRQYRDYECSAYIEGSKYEAPTLTNGGTAEFRICWDLDPDAAADSTVFVEDATTYDEASRVYWVSG